VLDLAEVVTLANNFFFGDDVLRAFDSRGVSPQLRHSYADEAKLAAPLVTGVVTAPHLADEEAYQDLLNDAETIEAGKDGPFDAQLVEKATMAQRNWFAALICGAHDIARREIKKTGKSIREGAERYAGAKALEWVMMHQGQIIAYAQSAYQGIDIAWVFKAIGRFLGL
jgi:hypothetical protein